MMGGQAGDVFPIQPDAPAAGPNKPGNDVKERGLPCPIRADQARNPTGFDAEGTVIHRANAAKPLGDVVDNNHAAALGKPRRPMSSVFLKI
jgi:hypothetical protein